MDKEDLEKRYRNLLFYARSKLLSELDFYDQDGVSYRDLQSIKGIPKGSLSPNLLILGKKGLIKRTKNHDNPIFYITPKGKEAFEKIREYLRVQFSTTKV